MPKRHSLPSAAIILIGLGQSVSGFQSPLIGVALVVIGASLLVYFALTTEAVKRRVPVVVARNPHRTSARSRRRRGDAISHRFGCPAKRLEAFDEVRPDGIKVRVERCIDCGAAAYIHSDAVSAPPPVPQGPETRVEFAKRLAQIEGFLDDVNATMERKGFGRNPNVPADSELLSGLQVARREGNGLAGEAASLEPIGNLELLDDLIRRYNAFEGRVADLLAATDALDHRWRTEWLRDPDGHNSNVTPYTRDQLDRMAQMIGHRVRLIDGMIRALQGPAE